MDTKNAPPLYTSDLGQISCLPHAPFPGSDTWHNDRWRLMTRRDAQEFEREIGRAARCETCRAERRKNGATR